MQWVKPEASLFIPGESVEEFKHRLYAQIEHAARTCYKSEGMICEGSAEKMIRKLIQNQHFAMLEHASLTVDLTVDRGITHELVRHRLAAFAQESTRYCNYSYQKFGNHITYVHIIGGMAKDPVVSQLPEDAQEQIVEEWLDACVDAERHYMRMLELGASPQIARSVLNNSTKSSIVITANVREWRHILSLRALGTTGKPHPQMIEVMEVLLRYLGTTLPELFGDMLDDYYEGKATE